MKLDKKTIAIGVGILAGAVVVYFAFFYGKSAPSTAAKTGKASSTGGSQGGASSGGGVTPSGGSNYIPSDQIMDSQIGLQSTLAVPAMPDMSNLDNSSGGETLTNPFGASSSFAG